MRGGGRGNRLVSVDALRGVAILLMIQVHFVQNLTPRAGWERLYDLSIWLGYLPAPIFAFLVGFSLWLWLEREEGSPASSWGIGERAIRRGVALFLGGLVFAVVIWLPYQVFDWDILTFLGAATAILYFMRKCPPGMLVAIAAAIMACSPRLREMSGYASHWRDDQYFYRFEPEEILNGFLLQGYFPLLPWLAFPLTGFASAELTCGLAYKRSNRMLPVDGVALIGLSALWAGGGGFLPRWLRDLGGGLSFYPASTAFILGALGLVLLGLWAFHVLLDYGGTDGFGWLARYGRFSLSTYVIHHAVHVWPMYAVALAAGPGDIERFYGNAISTPLALFLAFAFIMVFAPVLSAWEKRGGRWSFEHFLRWASRGGAYG